jgi:hypothetical protein
LRPETDYVGSKKLPPSAREPMRPLHLPNGLPIRKISIHPPVPAGNGPELLLTVGSAFHGPLYSTNGDYARFSTAVAASE